MFKTLFPLKSSDLETSEDWSTFKKAQLLGSLLWRGQEGRVAAAGQRQTGGQADKSQSTEKGIPATVSRQRGVRGWQGRRDGRVVRS